MPFSLNEEAEFNSPVNNILSDDDSQGNSASLEIELRNPKELNNLSESHIFESFDIFDNHGLVPTVRDRQNESEIPTKNNNVFDQSNLYLNLSNKMSYNKDDAHRMAAGLKLERYNKSLNYHHQTTAKTGHFTGANVTCAESNNKKVRIVIPSFY